MNDDAWNCALFDWSVMIYPQLAEPNGRFCSALVYVPAPTGSGQGICVN
jgi:hypothetical protein